MFSSQIMGQTATVEEGWICLSARRNVRGAYYLGKLIRNSISCLPPTFSVIINLRCQYLMNIDDQAVRACFGLGIIRD